ncbi:MAG: sigma-70 family RNA polymerase sigma factor [Proteobacteria bacterium]|nr:sigma-70 family RNA polymerase sigma factor [Pseudomonadota bacterium]
MPDEPEIDFEKLKAGDSAQWEEVWRDQHDYLFKVCAEFRLTLGSGPVEEHIQETFCKLREVLEDGRLKCYTHVRRWLRVTALNALRDEVDRVKTTKRGGGGLIPLEDWVESRDDPKSNDSGTEIPIIRADETKLERRVTPDEAVHRILLAADLEEAMGNISPQHANVLHDRFGAGLSYEEIAQKRKIKIGSVGVLKQRGLDAMLVRLPARDKMLWEPKTKALETPFAERKP